MRRVLFEWRGVKVYSYLAMLFLGLVAGVLGGTYGASHHGISSQRLLPPMLLLVAVAVAGSRFSYVALHWDAYRHDLGRIWRRSDSGAAQYGGLALAFLASLPLLPTYRILNGSFWDAAIITILIGTIFTRFGCLLNGCCGGRPSNGPLALCLPDAQGNWRRRFPTQLLEAGIAVALLVASLFTWGRLPFEGALFLGNLAAYGTARYWLQSLRETHSPADARLSRGFSLGLVAFSAGSFAFSWLLGLSLPWIGGPGNETLVGVAGPQSGIDVQLLILTTISVLGIVSLFHFAGCGCNLETNDLGYLEDNDGNPLYEATAAFENNTADHTQPPHLLLAYWKLIEQSPPTVIPGGQADDWRNALYPGVYKVATLPPLPDPQLDADHSPTTAQPGTLVLGAPGLLAFEAGNANTSMEVQGGFVEVGASADLNLPQFTIEALLFPTWDVNQLGRWYCVMEHTSPVGNKRFGVAIYAGPEGTGLAGLNTPYRWQVWMGITTGAITRFTQMKPVTNPKPLPLVDPNKVNYVAVTFDGSSVKLYATHEGKLGSSNLDLDQILGLDEPIAPGVYAPNPGPQPLLIGMGRDLFIPFNPAGDPRYPFQGRIQEVALYTAALKPERIFSHMAAAFEQL